MLIKLTESKGSNRLKSFNQLTYKIVAVICFLLFVDLTSARAEERIHKVVWKQVNENGLVATYLRPKGDRPVPPLVVLGGSQGGIPTASAYRFAERGWGALAVGYFGAPELPSKLANIPLEYFDRALEWLERQPNIERDNISVVGTSRGGELALLWASHNSRIKRVIAIVPSSVVWGPVGRFEDKTISAWTLHGQPLPYVPLAREPDYSAIPYRGTPDFLFSLRQTTLVEAASIPVEKIQGAVLLLSGDNDEIWPSSFMSRMVMKRLAAAHHPYRYEHLSFENAGHLIEPGSDPGLREAKHPTGIVIAFGGTKDGNRAAQKLGWAKMLEFLASDPRTLPATP